MKILQVISSLGNGGAEKFVVELSNQLSDANNVSLCTFKAVEDWMIFPKLLKKEVTLISLQKKNGFAIDTYKKLYSFFKTQNPDIVHFHLDATMKYIVPLVPFFPKVKFIYTIHSNLNADKIKLFKKLDRFTFISKKIKYVCISESIYEEFKKKFPQFNFILITNGINKPETSIQLPEVITEIESYKLSAQTKVFSIIGNYSGPKNFHLIVDVFAKLYEKKQNVILLIIGNDSTTDKVEWKKIENQRSHNTFMLGLKSNVQDYLFLSDAYCLCSIYEGLPISILEAYSLGKPVLSTPAGGVPSILKEKINGLLSSDFTLEAYYSMLLEFLKLSPEEINKISKNNLNDFKSKYTLDTVADKYILNYTN